MRSQRSYEGYLLIDHRASPGVPEEIMVAQGLAKDAGRADHLWETAVMTCSQCERQIILNPDRSRPRNWCKHCDHLHCDDCTAQLFASNGSCYPFKAKVKDYLEAVDRGIEPAVAMDAIFNRGEKPGHAGLVSSVVPSEVTQSSILLL